MIRGIARLRRLIGAAAIAWPGLARGQAGAHVESPALRLHQLESRVFGNTRTLRVLLPAGYDSPENASKTYAVLYMNDGRNLFDAATSTFSSYEWRMDETAAELLRRGTIEPMIVVGVDNAGRRDRPLEYLPYPDEFLRPPVPRPRGLEYPRFLVDEVMPLIRRIYRTRPGPEATGVGGSSYGGVAALVAAMKRPDVFGRLLLESPSLYISDERLLRDAAAVRRWPRRVYVAIGTKETGDAAGDEAAVRLVERFGSILRRAGLDEKRLLVVVDQGGIHREDAWARRLGRALEFLFGP